MQTLLQILVALLITLLGIGTLVGTIALMYYWPPFSLIVGFLVIWLCVFGMVKSVADSNI